MKAQERMRVVASHGLTDVDLSALHIFLNFSQHRTRGRWALGPLEEADLLLQPLGEPLPVLRGPLTIVWVGALQAGKPAGSDYALARPLQLEAVLELLLRMERQEARAQAHLAAAATEDFFATPEAMRTQPLGPPPAAPAAPVTAGPQPAPTFRLNRWPSASSLAAHRYLPRLASLLSSRHLSVFELARLSNVAPEECSAFLEDMQSEGILDTQLPSELPSGFDAADARRPEGLAAPLPPPANPTRLVGRLRARLRGP